MVAVIRFAVVPNHGQDLPADEIRVLVDGVDLVDLVDEYERGRGFTPAGGYGGLVPNWSSFRPMTTYFLGRTVIAEGQLLDRVEVLGCNCGISSCWPLVARITAGQRDVRWDDFSQPHRPRWDYSGFGPFVFDRAQYDEALAELNPFD